MLDSGFPDSLLETIIILLAMKEIIQAFLDQKAIAIAGASENKYNFGGSLMKELIGFGYRVLPVNPKYDEVQGVPCAANPKALPPDVDSMIVVVSPGITLEIVKDSVGSGIKRIWMHKGSGTGSFCQEALDLCRENNIDVVYGLCPMMFFGKGVHKLHLWWRTAIGKVPVEFNS